MAQIESFPGTRKKTDERLENLSQAGEPILVTILPEDDTTNITSVFIGESEGVYEFVSGGEMIESYTARGKDITLNGDLFLLRAFERKAYHQSDEKYDEIKDKMREVGYFQATGI